MSTEQMRFANRICQKGGFHLSGRQNKPVLPLQMHCLTVLLDLRTHAANPRCKVFGWKQPKALHLNKTKTD